MSSHYFLMESQIKQNEEMMSSRIDQNEQFEGNEKVLSVSYYFLLLVIRGKPPAMAKFLRPRGKHHHRSLHNQEEPDNISGGPTGFRRRQHAANPNPNPHRSTPPGVKSVSNLVAPAFQQCRRTFKQRRYKPRWLDFNPTPTLTLTLIEKSSFHRW